MTPGDSRSANRRKANWSRHATWQPRSRPSSRIVAPWTPHKAVHCKSLYRIFEQWLDEEDAPLTWNDKQFGTELRTAIPAIDRKRLSSGNDTQYNGASHRKDRLRLRFVAAVGLRRHRPEARTMQSELQLLTQVAAFSTCATPPRRRTGAGRFQLPCVR